MTFKTGMKVSMWKKEDLLFFLYRDDDFPLPFEYMLNYTNNISKIREKLWNYFEKNGMPFLP